MSAERTYPADADMHLAARDDSERYAFADPIGGLITVPATSREQARTLAADEFPGFDPVDFEYVADPSSFEPEPYKPPVESDREVTEYDLWMLRYAQRKHSSRFSPRRNPTKRMCKAIIDEWDEPTDVPLHDPEALQEAHGIGPAAVGRIIGAAVSNGLIERPVRGDE